MPTPDDFADFKFAVEGQGGNLGAGDFGQVSEAPTQVAAPSPQANGYDQLGTPTSAVDTFPYDQGNRQFSSDVSGNPEAVLESTRAAVWAHEELNAAFGLYQPGGDLGVHRWLRDGLGDSVSRELVNPDPPQPLFPGEED